MRREEQKLFPPILSSCCPKLGGKEYIGFTATGTIMRSQFGLTTGIPMVGDEVKPEIYAAFEKGNN